MGTRDQLYAEHEIARQMLTLGRRRGLKQAQLDVLIARDTEAVMRITEYNLKARAKRRP